MRSGTLRQKAVPLLLLASSAAAFAGTTDAAEKWPDQLALGGSEPRHWLDPDWQHPTPLSSNLTTPLGSVWKLFVYDYLQATHAQEAPLRCSGQQPEEERYCCDPGESIDRDQALIRSCGLYFSPDRLKLSPKAWRDYWQQQQAPLWLHSLAHLQATQQVQVSELLQALATIPPPIQQATRSTLHAVILHGRGQGGARELGTLLGIKSFTMADTQGPIGGGAGWSDNGTPLWFSGRGNSSQVISRLAPRLAAQLQREIPPHDTSCVQVDYFSRYPLARILDLATEKAAKAGPLKGHFQLIFQNGTQLAWQADEADFWLENSPEHPPRIRAQMPIEQYIARVVEREANAHFQQAAQALAVAARSYLYQEAGHQEHCLQIADSSRYQRVSPTKPSRRAKEVARATAGLRLAKVDVRYHADKVAPNQLSWQQAVKWEQEGLDFVAILARAYPLSSLQSGTTHNLSDCQPLQQAQNWLTRQQRLWQARLQREPGFEPTTPVVCLLKQGRPYADRLQGRLYVRPLSNQEGQIALCHEYLHLAFAHHPDGDDETYIEQLARSLVRGDE